MKTSTTTIATIIGLALGTLAAPAAAQDKTDKKLYCWEENGRKVCGDALPPGAEDAARTELSARSGMRVAEIGRALTPAERAEAEEAARLARIAETTEAELRRREWAMIESHDTEDDLRRSFGERTILVDEGIKTSRMGVDNLRQSLLSLLRQAADLELQGLDVDRSLSGTILGQHRDLQRQQTILQQQLAERAALDAELESALARYRELKAAKEKS